jgi:DNA polymerase IV
VAKTRKILHLDLDAFFCAVEEQLDPSLKGKAIAVGGQPDQRGVVASASYPARKFGVRSAMPMSQAVRLCPDLIIVPQTRNAYSECSKAVMALLHDTTPYVEPLSIDEAFLDVTILSDTIQVIAQGLRRRINEELDLPCSLGGATSKLLAKTANTIGKARESKDKPPNTILIVAVGGEKEFLAPLPIRKLWGVGPKTAQSLEKLGLRTIGDISRWSEDELSARFGKLGRDIWQRANAIDYRPVETSIESKSISKELTFIVDVRDEAKLKRTLRRLSDGVGRQTRKSDLYGSTVKIKLRWSDFTTLTRQMTLVNPTDRDDEIYSCAEELFDKFWIKNEPVRLIGVGLTGFIEEPNRQLSLWDDPKEEKQADDLQSTLDKLKDRFGESMIKRASDLDYSQRDDNKP